MLPLADKKDERAIMLVSVQSSEFKVYCHLHRYVSVQVHWNSCAFLRVRF